MKKLLLLLLVSVLSFSLLAGCSNSKTTGTEQNNEKEVSKCDPNKKAVLVVSFGTSHNETRKLTIEATEAKIAKAFPDYDFKKAFTSQFIINKLKKRDGLEIDNVKQALEKLVSEGYGEVLIQSLHVMNGAEYHDTLELVNNYKDKFEKITFGNPLLTSPEDYMNLVDVLSKEIPTLKEDEALFFMGHGTHHFSNSAYACLDYTFKYKGYDNIYIGTVEGYPSLDTLLDITKDKNYKKIYLMPLMVVAGDHAKNDMAGDEEDSWKMILESKGYKVEPIIKGLGQIEGVQDLYIQHLKDSLNTQEAE
ncbi:sirohydrochlorin cobaltochelatase [Abyssisolibacter fermentans]|uniref:sirohydrochlorin cobaltochelatase n=1 Tax=Abyssisolibacter fermentans TaxID=1766203 RepID=UPI0009E8678C|nr:sirohydrochlorin cobaltochelatase [Abyssisolibacter fermentans]